MAGLASLLAVIVVWLALRASVSQLPAPAGVKDGFSAFAIIYVIAQAIERFLEPFTHLDPINKTREQDRDEKVATASDTPTKDTVTQAADAQASLDTWQQVRMFLLWAAATVAGMILSATLGVYFLTMVMTSNLPDRSLDVLVTGIVVGGGSKALHDLIANVQQAKDDKTKPMETK